MARKPRKPILDYFVYLAVRSFVCTVQALAPAVAWHLADILAWAAYHLDRRHRLIAAENIRYAFTELADSPDRVDRMVRATYRHFTRTVVEVLLFPRKLQVRSWRQYVNMYPGIQAISPLYYPRPALVVTAHFGNWELIGSFVGLIGFKTYAIARSLDNPHLERFTRRFRQAWGQTLIAKKDDFDRLTQTLRSGAKVGTLADQDAGPRGLFVDFFGRPASTHKAVALMAMEFDAVLLVVGAPRVSEPMFFEIACEAVIDPRDYAAHPDPVRAITERYTAALERMIRRHPEQYFWFHRRWKSQPSKRERKPAKASAA